ncbi:glycosyltransferase family 117 protein [Ekhidna sp.]
MKINAINRKGIYFIIGFALQLVALLMMALDPEPHGFGMLTLGVGSIVLMTGILLPVFGMVSIRSMDEWPAYFKKEPLQNAGLLIVFFTSFITYLLTLEPTASLWDCSEMIAAAYKLQVPHTPGTPLTLLMGRLFSMLALGDVTRVAWYVNLMSAFFSAGAVGFTFLISWYLGGKLFKNQRVLFAGSFGGALCLAFSDSFWFSAVEAETYGPSIFCMMLLIWLSKEGSKLSETDQQKRIKLLSYLTGLSYCVHPMCILVLPVCFLIWRGNMSFNWKSIAISFGLGVASILIISKVVAVDLFEWIFRLDLLLVNNWYFPFYSGLFLLALLVASITFIVWNKFPVSRIVVTSAMLVIAGFTPYIMLFVRSAQHPPINEFSPSNLAKIKPYMNRESYPSRPLLYGPYFDAQIDEVSPKAKSYIVNEGRYEEVGEISTYHYQDDRMTILPRIYSNDHNHMETYRKWTNLSVGEKPRFGDNLTFMWKYQLGHMYGRYMMWNFAGRSSDVQHAEWLTPWKGLANRSAIDYNRANNQYFMIPILLGLLGFIIQSKKDRNGFMTQLSFFLITGVLLVMYLNGTPNEPRERDYIYVGSYVAFSIWIGLGIMSLSHIVKNKKVVYLSAFIAFCVPAWMFYQNLDDHNRSNRTFQIDHARNVLNSCDEGAVLFTGADNDTFPLWYLQEVEDFRTDVRVMVLSYFNADWYINQLSRAYYDSPPFNLTLKYNENQYGPYEPLYIREVMNSPISWGKYMDALKADNPQLKVKNASGDYYHFLPSKQISLTTSKGPIDFSVKANYLAKNELAILDLLYSNGWDRPIYFNYTSMNSINIDIQPYLSQEGMIYKWTPHRSSSEGTQMNLEKSYENLVKNADYSNLANEDIYFNQEDYEARMIAPIKFAFNQLIRSYLEQDNRRRAEELANFAYQKLYFEHLKPSYADVQLGHVFLLLKREKESEELINRVFLYYYDRLSLQLASAEAISRNDLLVLQESAPLLRDTNLIQKYQKLVSKLSN